MGSGSEHAGHTPVDPFSSFRRCWRAIACRAKLSNFARLRSPADRSDPQVAPLLLSPSRLLAFCESSLQNSFAQSNHRGILAYHPPQFARPWRRRDNRAAALPVWGQRVQFPTMVAQQQPGPSSRPLRSPARRRRPLRRPIRRRRPIRPPRLRRPPCHIPVRRELSPPAPRPFRRVSRRRRRPCNRRRRHGILTPTRGPRRSPIRQTFHPPTSRRRPLTRAMPSRSIPMACRPFIPEGWQQQMQAPMRFLQQTRLRGDWLAIGGTSSKLGVTDTELSATFAIPVGYNQGRC